MKAVIDTNVLVSGMIRPAGPPGRLVDLLRAGTLQPVVDDRILDEYADVLCRPTMQTWFAAADAEAIVAFLVHHADPTLATISVRGLPDPDDAPFLEVALSAGVPLVTGNKRHFTRSLCGGCTILTPAGFLARFCSA